jgi:hypothetical protein
MRKLLSLVLLCCLILPAFSPVDFRSESTCFLISPRFFGGNFFSNAATEGNSYSQEYLNNNGKDANSGDLNFNAAGTPNYSWATKVLTTRTVSSFVKPDPIPVFNDLEFLLVSVITTTVCYQTIQLKNRNTG